MAKTMQQVWDYALFLVSVGSETKGYTHGTARIMKYGAVRKFSHSLKHLSIKGQSLC